MNQMNAQLNEMLSMQ